jgi:hypothetical protein
MFLDIKNIKVYLLSPGVDKYRDRVLTVFQRLLDEGFKDVNYFKSVKGTNNTESLTNTVLEIFKRELNTNDPFIILEDDCAFFSRYDTIEVPDTWDCLYLGVSLWSYPHAIDTLYTRNRPNIVLNSRDTNESYNDSLVRIKGMTATHAILYNSREFMKTFIEKMNMISKNVNDCPHDLVFSSLHSSFTVYGLKHPMFYQDSALGGQEDVTKLCFNGECYR